MFINHLRTSFRHFRKNKITTLINIVGLSVGISAALIIFMIVKYDYSFDTNVPDSKRVYRLVSDGDGWKNQGVPVPVAAAIPGSITGVESVAPIFEYNDMRLNVKVDSTLFKKQEQVVFADAGYFSIFPHTWLAGNPTSALRSPNTVVLSKSRANIYFPGIPVQDLIGRTIIFSDTLLTTVTGIVADREQASDFHYAAFVSLPTVFSAALKEAYQTEQWNSTNSANQVLLKLSPHVQPATVEKQIAALFKEHLTGDYDTKTTHPLQPLSDIHINADFGGNVNPSSLRYLALLALVLLLLGAINFVNLSTAQSSARAREIGIRKTLGSLKRQLIAQFLTETFILTLLTALLSLATLPLLLQAFEGFVPEGLSTLFLFQTPVIWAFLLLLCVVVSVVAGIYPAWVLTRFQPVAVLKNVVAGGKSAWLRRGLIIVQFVIAQVFLIGVLVVEKQIRYAVNKDMGFRKDAVINFYVPMDFASPNNKKHTLKKEISHIAGVQEVSLGNQSPAFNGTMTTEIRFKDAAINASSRNGDTNYLRVYGISLVAGRNILTADTASEVLINETMARKLGFKQPADAIGQIISSDNPMPVVGVMRDFNQASVRAAVAPLIYYGDAKHGYVMHVAMYPGNVNNTLDQIEQAWKNIYPEIDFEYAFLDQQIAKFYKKEKQLSHLLTWSAGVAMLISCLGILGLVIFITNTRVKEIGVRKVLGATVSQIIILLSVDFAKLLGIAFLIAIPIAWWEAREWLQNFAFHTNLSWWVFLLSGSLMLFIALLIVGVRAGRAAFANPVKSLRMD